MRMNFDQVTDVLEHAHLVLLQGECSDIWIVATGHFFEEDEGTTTYHVTADGIDDVIIEPDMECETIGKHGIFIPGHSLHLYPVNHMLVKDWRQNA